MNKKKDIAFDWLRRYTGTDPSKYGDWILYKPSFNIINSFLWILPYVFLIIGAVFILAVTRKQLKK